MPISATFTVNGSGVTQAHQAAFASTVNLALTSLTDVKTIAWSIASTSKSGQASPAITAAGSPTGATASFSMPADPGDGLGRAFIVQCTVTGAGTTATHRAVVGAVNDNNLVPICVDEELERNATHGWGDDLNEFLATVGGGGGPVTLPIDADHGDIILRGTIDAGGTDAPLVTWGTNTDELLIGDATDVAGIATHVGPSGYLEWWINGTEEYSASSTEFNFRTNNVLTEGYLQIGATVAASGSIRGGTSLSIVGLSGANDMELIKASSGSIIIGETTHAANVEIQAATSHVFDVGGSDLMTLTSSGLALGSTPLTASAVAITGGTISDGVNLVGSSLNEAVANSASSANIDTAITASKTDLYRIEADAEISSGTRAYVVGMCRVVRSGSNAPTVSSFQTQFSEGSGLAVSATISSNSLRVSVANTMGSGCRLDTRIWRISQKDTVEHS